MYFIIINSKKIIFANNYLERWPSGLRRTLGKRVSAKVLRGFESLPLYNKSPIPISNYELLFNNSNNNIN